MGYVREKTYRLVFTEDEFDGLEVRCRAVSIGTFMRVAELTGDGLRLQPENEERINETIDIVGAALIGWNLQDADGVDVPATAESLREQDKDFAVTVIDAWLEALAGVPGPLEQPSPAGDRSLEASLPMAPSSPSLAS